MNVKVKLFYQDADEPIDKQINKFLSFNNREYVDVKLIFTENTFQTQTNVMVLLAYRP